MIDENFAKRNPKRRVEAPRLVFFLIPINFPLLQAFGQTLENSVFSTVITAQTFVEKGENVDLGLDACFLAAIVAVFKGCGHDWRVATSLKLVIRIC